MRLAVGIAYEAVFGRQGGKNKAMLCFLECDCIEDGDENLVTTIVLGLIFL